MRVFFLALAAVFVACCGSDRQHEVAVVAVNANDAVLASDSNAPATHNGNSNETTSGSDALLIDRWSSSITSTGDVSSGNAYNVLSYTKFSGQIFAYPQQNPNATAPLDANAKVFFLSEDDQDNMDSAMDTLSFSSLQDSYQSSGIVADAETVTITLFAGSSSKSIPCQDGSPLPAGLKVIFDRTTSMRFE